MGKNYIKTGKCIWCGQSTPNVTFNSEPHIVPHSLGGQEIGVDICKECNNYFGSATVGVPSINLSFKEIFNAFRFFGNNLDENSYKHFKSSFFEYRHSKRKIIIKKNFNSRTVTELFKRGLYEVFLQKYHAVTGNGNHPMFDMVRRYARYGQGHPHIYYAFNNIIFSTTNDEKVILNMSKVCIKDMMKSGVFKLWLFGHFFYMETIPLAFRTFGRSFLQEEANKVLIPAIGNERIYEFNDVMEIDFCMERFNF